MVQLHSFEKSQNNINSHRKKCNTQIQSSGSLNKIYHTFYPILHEFQQQEKKIMMFQSKNKNEQSRQKNHQQTTLTFRFRKKTKKKFKCALSFSHI